MSIRLELCIRICWGYQRLKAVSPPLPNLSVANSLALRSKAPWALPPVLHCWGVHYYTDPMLAFAAAVQWLSLPDSISNPAVFSPSFPQCPLHLKGDTVNTSFRAKYSPVTYSWYLYSHESVHWPPIHLKERLLSLRLRVAFVYGININIYKAIWFCSSFN